MITAPRKPVLLLRTLFLVFLCAAGAPVQGAPRSAFFTTSDGVQLHYTYSVAGAAPTLLFVPGWTMPGNIWTPQTQYFSGKFKTVVLDPRSQGESEIARTGHEPHRRAQDIKELIDTLDLRRVVLVGWSLGVLESLAYVKFFGDDRLVGLVLVDNSVGEDPPPVPTDFLRRYKANRVDTMQRFVRGMFHSAQPESYYRKLTRFALKTPLNAAVDLLTNLYPREVWRAAVYQTTKPILYVVTPRLAGQARNLKRHRPDAWTAVFERAGHALFVDEPDRFNRLMEEFLYKKVLS